MKQQEGKDFMERTVYIATCLLFKNLRCSYRKDFRDYEELFRIKNTEFLQKTIS